MASQAAIRQAKTAFRWTASTPYLDYGSAAVSLSTTAYPTTAQNTRQNDTMGLDGVAHDHRTSTPTSLFEADIIDPHQTASRRNQLKWQICSYVQGDSTRWRRTGCLFTIVTLRRRQQEMIYPF